MGSRPHLRGRGRATVLGFAEQKPSLPSAPLPPGWARFWAPPGPASGPDPGPGLSLPFCARELGQHATISAALS